MSPHRAVLALPPIVILTLLAVSGCPSSDDDDDTTAGDDDSGGDSWFVVADGLYDGEPSRYSGQKKIVALENGALLAVFNVGDADHPPGFHHLFAALSLDGGQSWSAPEQISDPGLDHVGWGSVAALGDQVAVVYPAASGSDQVLLTVRRGSFDGAALTWADPQIPVAVPEIVGALFPTVVFDGAGALHVVARVETDYDPGCDVDTEDCPQERRHVVYLTDEGGSWEARTLSQRWTSTVPELRIDLDGGADGAAGRGRLTAVWHNEDRPDVAFGAAVDHPSLWTRDLDDGSEELASVPDAWLGEGPGAEVKTGLLPTVALDAGGRVHVAYAHVDAAYDLRYWYTARDDAGAWLPPEPVDPGGDPISGGAQLVIGAGDEPVLAATTLAGDGGSVVVLSRGDGAWLSQPLITSEEHGFNWAGPSQEPVDGARYGLLFGRRDAPEWEGTLYYLAF